jgi:hypothetical protein
VAVQIVGLGVVATTTGLLTPRGSNQEASVQLGLNASTPSPSIRSSSGRPVVTQDQGGSPVVPGTETVVTGTEPAGTPSLTAAPGATTRVASRRRATTTTQVKKTQVKTTQVKTTPPTTTTTAGTPSRRLALGFAIFQTEVNGLPSPQFADYKSAVGSLPSFFEDYRSWPTSATNSPPAPLYFASEAALFQTDHLTPIISWSSDATSLTTIVKGGTDAYALAPAAALAKSYPGTLYIRLDWEMNGSWSAWNPSNSAQAGLGENPATFVAMWQHVVNYFRAAGVTNVRWVWSPNVDGGTGTMAAYYPGDNYVDDVALDGYNYAYTQGASWQTPKQVFGASYAELEGITHKSVIIAETSSVEANSTEASQGLSKAYWIQQLSSYVPTLSNVIAVCWFHQPALVNGYGTVNFGVDSSSAALSAWKQYFVSNPQYQGRLPS